ncbi:MAG TPA: hypothetical protein VHM70_27755 [Polyangiaceae bacterium]|jgi:hypothetical protein|nr:hypothetical protein [Polyangiaceae bacterium]
MIHRFISKSLLAAVFGLSSFALAPAAHAQQFATQFLAADSLNWKQVGLALAIDANTFVVGAPESIRNNDSTNCSLALSGYGSIGIYKKSGNAWSYAQTFWHDQTTETNEIKFGGSLSLRGNVLVVSAERQDHPTAYDAGAFVVFTRPNATSNFTKLGTYFAPTPTAGGRMGETSGLASNTQFIAVGDPLSNSVFVYKIGASSVTYAYSIPLPVGPARYGRLFITDSNVLVGTIQGRPTLEAYRLGQTNYTTLSTTALSRPNTTVLNPMSGDGNTVVTVLRDNTTGSLLTQVSNFAGGAIGWVDNRPIAPGLGGTGSLSAISVTVKENQGFFVGMTGASAPLALSYKFTYNGGSGHDYNYEGLFTPASYPQTSSVGGAATQLAFNGSDLLLGDPGLDNHVTTYPCFSYSTGGVDVFSVGPVTAAGPSGSTKLQPWISSSQQDNGEVTALYSGYAVLGQASFPNENGLIGQATLYRQVGTSWEQLEKYVDGRAGLFGTALTSYFGSAAAINWHSLLISAPAGGSPATGVVYHARAVNGAFEHGPLMRALPLPPNLHENDDFGSSLALDNDTLIVGAIQGGPEGSRNGAAYIYSYNSGTQNWTYAQELAPPSGDLKPWLAFGAKVGISGDWAVVSAPYLDANGLSETGGLYVYHRVNGTFSYVQRVLPPTPTEFDDFGQTLSIANGGNYIAASGNYSGVRLFRLSGSTFVSDGSVSVPTLQYASVALSNVGLIVGTPGDGRVRRFTRASNNNWPLGGTLQVSAQSFGLSVSIYDSNVLIGAPTALFGTLASGAGYATTFSNVH